MGHERELPSVDSYSTTTLRITLSKQTFQKTQNNPGLVFALLFYTLTNFKIPSSLIFTMQISHLRPVIWYTAIQYCYHYREGLTCASGSSQETQPKLRKEISFSRLLWFSNQGQMCAPYWKRKRQPNTLTIPGGWTWYCQCRHKGGTGVCLGSPQSGTRDKYPLHTNKNTQQFQWMSDPLRKGLAKQTREQVSQGVYVVSYIQIYAQ